MGRGFFFLRSSSKYRRVVFSGSILVLIGLIGTDLASGLGQLAQQQSQEEREDYYRHWLNEDVIYLITPDEKAVFNQLSNDDERDQFIEQFWFRRDPDLTTPSNEFKEEHYRRLAYANERFKSGVPGWKTDRGKIYIIHGEPVEIEKHRSGENYERPSNEGGGYTAVFAFEIWRYHHIEGIGDDIELEFVDPSGSGEFRLALTPWEKDAFFFAPGLGATVAESMGMATRSDHPYFSPYNRETYPMMTYGSKDDPFIRYETRALVQRPKQIKYQDLKEIVDVNVSYQTLPFRTRIDYFRLNEERVLVPITFELDNKDLTFDLENGVYLARAGIYGLVTSITNRVVTEFEDDLVVSFKPEDFENGLQARSIYQKIIPVEQRYRHRLDLVVKDLKSEKVGVKRLAVAPPSFEGKKLTASSMILSDFIYQIQDVPDQDMFLLGDIKIRPNPSQEFSSSRLLGVYLQIYNAGIDQSTSSSSLAARFHILRNGKMVKYWAEHKGESIQFQSSQRIVLIKPLPIQGLEPDDYKLVIEIEDRIGQNTIEVQEDFKIKG